MEMDKVSKQKAKYTTKDRKYSDFYNCNNCIFYGTNQWNNNNKCLKVEGYISKQGYCPFFQTMTISRIGKR